PAARAHAGWPAAQRRRVLPALRADHPAHGAGQTGCDRHASGTDQPRRRDRIGGSRRRAVGDPQSGDLWHRRAHGGALHDHERPDRAAPARKRICRRGAELLPTDSLGARLIAPASGRDEVTDIYCADGKILAIGQAPAGFTAQQSIQAQGLVAAPGLVDLSVALREPGYSRKGNISSETLAATAGGITSLCCPPQTRPVLDTAAVADLILDRARE